MFMPPTKRTSSQMRHSRSPTVNRGYLELANRPRIRFSLHQGLYILHDHLDREFLFYFLEEARLSSEIFTASTIFVALISVALLQAAKWPLNRLAEIIPI